MSDPERYALLHNSTIIIDDKEYPAIQISLITQEDIENSQCGKGLDFFWEITRYEGNQMTIQLYFADPACVSVSSNLGDIVSIKFNDFELFRDTEGNYMQ